MFLVVAHCHFIRILDQRIPVGLLMLAEQCIRRILRGGHQ
jgi:hypothetical protein